MKKEDRFKVALSFPINKIHKDIF